MERNAGFAGMGLRAGTMKRAVFVAALAALTVHASDAGAAGDAKMGEYHFDRCKVCHSLQEGANGIGPSLHGLLGRRAGTVPNYRYTDEMTAAGAKGLVWTEDTLFRYLADPGDFLKRELGKTKIDNEMPPRFPNADFRRNVIEYLKNATK
ncbi:MAG: cytochrome c family protein [Alphaproteobacteria bacterium]